MITPTLMEPFPLSEAFEDRVADSNSAAENPVPRVSEESTMPPAPVVFFRKALLFMILEFSSPLSRNRSSPTPVVPSAAQDVTIVAFYAET